MPTYQYACTGCDHAFDQVQSFSDDSLTVCPQCEGRLRKVFNAVGVVFKGSGFYRTDSRTDNRTDNSRDTKAPSTTNGSSTPSSATNGESSSANGKSSSSKDGGSADTSTKSTPSTAKDTSAA